MSMFAQPRHQGRRGGKSRLGHLKLSVREESSALVITIHEARGLKRKDGSPSDTYVKLYLRPDPRKLTKEKTRRVKEKDPVFNQRFSYVLSDEDLSKSLSVSVWNRDWTGRSEVIGCMSFAVADLLGPGKEVHGWYELLDIHKGAIENVMVPDSLSRMGSQSSLNSMSSNSIFGPKKYAVVLVKGPRGYGFSVSTETSPVMITDVQEGLAAYQQDLRVGDAIIEVDNTDVTRANSDMIVNMIKKCKESVYLIVLRNPPYSSGAAAATSSQPFLSQSYTDLSNGVSRRGDRRFQDSRRFSTGGMTQPPDMQSSHWQQYPVDDRIRMVSTSRERVNMSRSGERLPEVPEEGRSQTSNLNIPLPMVRPTLTSVEPTTPTSLSGRKISQPSSQRYEGMEHSASQRHLSSSQPGGLNTSFAPTPAKHVKQLSGDLGTVKKLSLGSPTGGEQDALLGLAMQSVTKMHPANHQQGGGASNNYQPRSLYSSKLSTSSYGSSDSAYATGQSSRSLNPDERQSPSAASSPQRLSPERGLNRSQSGAYSGTGSPDQMDGSLEELEWESLGRLEQKRQRAINSLLKCEREFFEELQNGVTTFMTPLGQGVLSEDSHRTIFMNIGKMFELSRYVYTQLEARATQYCSRSSSVPQHVECIADIYHNKLQAIIHVFSGYLRNADNAHKEIAISFTNAEFKRIVQEPGRRGRNLSTIYNFVDGGKEYLCKMSRLLVAISNLTPPIHPDHSHLYLTSVIKGLMEILPNSCRDLVKAWNSQLEMMEGLRLRIAFNNNVVPFPISIPGRFLVHDGEVMLLEKKKKKKVSLWLFSDILLITKRTGRILGTLEPPIQLNQLLVQDLNCSVVEDFHTSTADGSINRQFRAPTVQAKVDWMQKLKERSTGHLIMKGKGGAKRVGSTSRTIQLQQPGGPGRVKLTMEEEEQMLEALQLPSALTQPVDDMDAVHRRSATQSHRHHVPKFLRWKKSSNTHLSQDSNERPSRRPRPQSLVAIGTQDFLLDLEKKKNARKQSKSDLLSEPATIRVEQSKLKVWASSFDILLSDSLGIQLFQAFLKGEVSEENILFWKACQSFKNPQETPDELLQAKAQEIFAEYISMSPSAPNLVNIDHHTRESIMAGISKPTRTMFSKAELCIYKLMCQDSFSRFIQSRPFKEGVFKDNLLPK